MTFVTLICLGWTASLTMMGLVLNPNVMIPNISLAAYPKIFIYTMLSLQKTLEKKHPFSLSAIAILEQICQQSKIYGLYVLTLLF